MITPKLLEGRNLLDTAAYLVIESGNAEIDPLIRSFEEEVKRDQTQSEEEQFLASFAESKRAARRLLGALFVEVSPAELDDAWSRAQALDEAATRLASKAYGYPGTEADHPPAPVASREGFTLDLCECCVTVAPYRLRCFRADFWKRRPARRSGAGIERNQRESSRIRPSSRRPCACGASSDNA